MIRDLLPRYYEDHGPSPITYDPVRSFVIDGHEVWWAEYHGKMIVEPFDDFSGRSLVCECDFTPGVGYEIEDGHVLGLDGERDCVPRAAACHLRQLELRKEYLDRYGDRHSGFSDGNFVLAGHVKEIVLDMILRAKSGEFLGEDSGGAGFWGGYFYAQTVAGITDRHVGDLWTPLYELCREKKISLEGSVVQDYREPPPPKWEEFLRLEDDGWVGVAYLPGNRAMAREWKLEVLRPGGEPAYAFLPGLGLDHDPVFGPDADDVARAEARLRQAIADARRPRTKPRAELAE